MCSKSMKMMFVASIIRYKLYMFYVFFNFFVKKSFLTKNHFLIAAINLTTRSPLYTCIVLHEDCTLQIFKTCTAIFRKVLTPRVEGIQGEVKSLRFCKQYVLISNDLFRTITSILGDHFFTLKKEF